MPQPKTPSAPSHQGRSATGKVPGAGLHSIAATGKRYGMGTTKATLAMPSYAPARPGASDAAKLPSLSAFVKG